MKYEGFSNYIGRMEGGLDDRYPYYRVQQDLHSLDNHNDKRGVIGSAFYKFGIYNRGTIVYKMRNLMKNRSGHEIIDFERTQLNNTKNYYGDFLQLILVHLHDGSVVYRSMPVNVKILGKMLSYMDEKYLQFKRADMSNDELIDLQRKNLEKQHKTVNYKNALDNEIKQQKAIANINYPFY